MKNLKVTWKGITLLIMHSCQCVNPLHPISKEIRKLNDKPRGQKLTEEELERLSTTTTSYPAFNSSTQVWLPI